MSNGTNKYKKQIKNTLTYCGGVGEVEETLHIDRDLREVLGLIRLSGDVKKVTAHKALLYFLKHDVRATNAEIKALLSLPAGYNIASMLWKAKREVEKNIYEINKK